MNVGALNGVLYYTVIYNIHKFDIYEQLKRMSDNNAIFMDDIWERDEKENRGLAVTGMSFHCG